MSAIACAASGILSFAHWIRTTACTVMSVVLPSVALEDDGQTLSARDAERRQAERRAASAHLVREGQDHAGAAHADRVADGDAAAIHVQPVPVELQLTLARDHLGGEGLVDLDQVDV